MKILVTVPFQKEHQEELKKAAPDALFFFKDAYTIDDKRDEKLYHAFLKEADIIIGNPSIEEIASAPKLKFVQSSNAGVEKYSQDFQEMLCCVVCQVHLEGLFQSMFLVEY